MLMTPPVSQPPPHLTVRRQVDSDPSHIRIPTKLHPILSQFIMGGKLMIPKITKACGIDFKRSLSSTTKNSSLNSFKLCVFDYVHISKQKPLKDNFCFAERKKNTKSFCMLLLENYIFQALSRCWNNFIHLHKHQRRGKKTGSLSTELEHWTVQRYLQEVHVQGKHYWPSSNDDGIHKEQPFHKSV